MSIKLKVTLGVLFLFVVILGIGGLGLYYLQQLSADSENILTDNYETLQYTKEIITQCDRIRSDSAEAKSAIKKSLLLQQANITEAGEGELTRNLNAIFARLKSKVDDASIIELRGACLAIQQINMEAIQQKNESARKTSKNASTYLIILGSFCILAAFTFIINFPGYIANPIAQLTSGIKEIANK